MITMGVLRSIPRKVTACALAVALAAPALAAPALANSADEPTAGEMAIDVLIARPVGIAVTALGGGAFIISLPFSALGGNVEQAADQLVVKPAKAAFVRCLGCTSAGRYVDPDDVDE